jgi:hypothetical protein
MSKTTAKIIKKHAILAGHWLRPHVSAWLRKLSIKVLVLNAILVAMCMPHGDTYHTRSSTRNAGASVQRAFVARQAQPGRLPRPVARNVQAAIGIKIGIERYPLFITNLRLYDSYKE